MLSSLEELAWDVRDAAEAWCAERSGWVLRALLLSYLVYGGGRTFFSEGYRTWFGGLIFALHEMGHLLFAWFGQWLSVAGGTGLQLAAPVFAGLHLLLKQRDYFGVCVCGAWLAFALQDASVYIGDARAQALPLIGFSAHPIHDWNYLLSSVGLLGWDGFFAGFAWGAGLLVWGASCAAGGWLCLQIARHGAPNKLG